MITSIDTIQAVARHAAANPPAPRNAPDNVALARLRRDQPPGSGTSLAGLLPRVVRVLGRLLFTPASAHILAQAITTFLPLLDLDWLPAEPGAIPKPTIPVKARIDLLRQERAARARLRGAVARHRPARRARPDRPPENRAVSAPGIESGGDLWHDLLDLTSEALETFIAYGHQDGVGRCADLLDLLADTFNKPRPAAA